MRGSVLDSGDRIGNKTDNCVHDTAKKEVIEQDEP